MTDNDPRGLLPLPGNGASADRMYPGPARPGPVIVLTMARSGSTLLRFILDSHPDLACPPETSLGSACFMLARLWDLLNPSAESAAGGFRPHQVPVGLPDVAMASIRAVFDDVYGRYLARHGKRRWCDKSLDNIGIAALLAEVYPQAQFVCLYRHCLDVIVSAVEACPWGLGGYGFDQYAAGNPGNSVAAVALCWLDQTRPIIEFQDKYPDRCHGIRYEDLVTRPEQIAASLFDFLGVEQVPGITADCFAAAHDIRGPGDHKIWFTAGISPGSLGQGSRVPVGLIPPPMLAEVNEALARLDYRQVDEHWPDAAGGMDPRADQEPVASPPEDSPGPDTEVEADAAKAALAHRLATAGTAAGLAGAWPAASGPVALVIRPTRGSAPAAGWTLRFDDDSCLIIDNGAEPSAMDPAATVIAATGATWLAIVTGQANLAAELRAGRLQIKLPTATPHNDMPAGLPAELRLLAQLLGLKPLVTPRTPQLDHTQMAGLTTTG